MKKLLFLLFLLCISWILSAQQKLTPELMWKFGRVNDIRLSPDKKSLLFGITYYDLAANKGNRDLYLIPISGGNAVNITNSSGSEYNGIWRPDGKKIGYLSAETGEMQIWEMNPDGSSKTQISRHPGGINGFAWSPDGTRILFIADVKLDKNVNDLYPDLPKTDAMVYDDLFYRHWDSWTDYSYSHIFASVYTDGQCGSGIDIMAGERYDAPLSPDGGMEQISWSADSRKIAYTCRKLNGREEAVSTNSDIYLYDIGSGITLNLSESMPGYDQDPVFSPDGKSLAWCSMKTPGYESDQKDIIVYDLLKGTHVNITGTFDESAFALNWSHDSKMIYFLSYTKATCQVFSVKPGEGLCRQLTAGIHDYTELATDGKVFAGVRMSMSSPSEIYRLEPSKEGLTGKQLSFVNTSLLETISMGKVESRMITTSDGKQMLVWVIFPPDFDKTKKYPALLYCQGGPQSAVSQFFSYRWNFQMMAAAGYIVVAPNRRGLPSFGSVWNDQIALDYGGQNMKDYLTAIDTLAAEPYVNETRLGAVGASYGGFSVYWLAGNHNKRFKAFIAHCGMFNLESWYGTTEEMWFANHDLGGAYWEKPSPKSYDFSPHRFVGNWDTPIMVIHGGRDFRIPYTEGMQAFDAAQLKGIPSRFLFFPNENHFVLKPQNSVLWQREFFRWLDEWLKK